MESYSGARDVPSIPVVEIEGIIMESEKELKEAALKELQF